MSVGLFAPTVNLTILVGVMVYYGRGPLKRFVAQRHENIRSDLHKTGEQLRSAQEKFDEYSAKLKAIEAELLAIRDQSKQDADSMRVRVLTDAKRLADVIVQESRTSSTALAEELKGQLQVQLADEVLDRAQVLVRTRLTKEDQVRLQSGFKKQLEVQA